MPYTRRQLAELKANRVDAEAASAALVEKYIVRRYAVGEAKTYAHHGFARRIYTMHRCIDRVFSIIPPGARKIPKRFRVEDVMINIQAFVFNTFGCLDNLAWIWVIEKNVLGKDGGPLTATPWAIGLRSKLVLASYAPAFRSRVNEFAPWIAYLEDFRHALAHRIPLYVPPHIVTPADEAEYQALNEAVGRALEARDWQGYFDARSKLQSVGSFEPLMLHHYDEGRGPIRYHAQLLSDLTTVIDLGERLLAELDRPTA